jgi:hypothetical protein
MLVIKASSVEDINSDKAGTSQTSKRHVSANTRPTLPQREQGERLPDFDGDNKKGALLGGVGTIVGA